MKVKYIGNCVKTDSITGVGLIWEPGQEREVTSTVAEHLLSYTDTWVKAKDATHNEAPDEPVDVREKEKLPEEPLPVVDFHGMNKAALTTYAMEKWNEKFDKRMSETAIRERVIKLFTKHEMADTTS